jgi:glutamine amidotransferase
MASTEVVIVDYGVGNIRSVSRALEYSGAIVTLSCDPDVISKASRVLLPGVGAFPKAIESLHSYDLHSALRETVAKGNMLFGICLGMQLLFDSSDEFTQTSGLGLIPGRVKSILSGYSGGELPKVPHIGWTELYPAGGESDWKGLLMRKVPLGAPVYFVHSYFAEPENKSDRIADGIVDSMSITATVEHDNVFGCQFHPEKSGKIGLSILERFLSL